MSRERGPPDREERQREKRRALEVSRKRAKRPCRELEDNSETAAARAAIIEEQLKRNSGVTSLFLSNNPGRTYSLTEASAFRAKAYHRQEQIEELERQLANKKAEHATAPSIEDENEFADALRSDRSLRPEMYREKAGVKRRPNDDVRHQQGLRRREAQLQAFQEQQQQQQQASQPQQQQQAPQEQQQQASQEQQQQWMGRLPQVGQPPHQQRFAQGPNRRAGAAALNRYAATRAAPGSSSTAIMEVDIAADETDVTDEDADVTTGAFDDSSTRKGA